VAATGEFIQCTRVGLPISQRKTGYKSFLRRGRKMKDTENVKLGTPLQSLTRLYQIIGLQFVIQTPAYLQTIFFRPALWFICNTIIQNCDIIKP
jgi:hypothetical protein